MSSGRRIALAHPVAVLAIGLLILNDHLLKDLSPGFVTGKLSDVAGLVFVPLLIVSVFELTVGHRSRTVAVAAVVCTGVVFASIQLWGPAADIYRLGLGYLQFPFRALFGGAVSANPVQHTADLSDLLTLPALWLAWKLATSRDRSPRVDVAAPIAKRERLQLEKRARRSSLSKLRSHP